VAFDLLRLEGKNVRLRPLQGRRGALLLRRQRRRQALAAEGAVVFKKACELNLEGIVPKRESSCFYKSGPSRNWLKTTNPDFVRA
jgi:ATP-dependent DNA ligase